MISGVYYFERTPNMGGIQFQKGYQINHNLFYPDIWIEYDEATATQAVYLATDLERYDFAVQAGKYYYYKNFYLLQKHHTCLANTYDMLMLSI